MLKKIIQPAIYIITISALIICTGTAYAQETPPADKNHEKESQDKDKKTLRVASFKKEISLNEKINIIYGKLKAKIKSTK
ncbi:MAG: hypothetical protein ABIH42_04970, partial [Planctomycetota bacterium]